MNGATSVEAMVGPLEESLVEETEDEVVEATDGAAPEDDVEKVNPDHERLVRIEELARKCQQRKAEYEEAKAEASCCKQALDAAHEALTNEILSPRQKPMPLLKGVASDATSASVEGDWRDVPVAELGLSAATCEALKSKQLVTLGDIADYTCDENSLRDIKGIGEKKESLIEDAIAAYWKRRHASSEPSHGQTHDQ